MNILLSALSSLKDGFFMFYLKGFSGSYSSHHRMKKKHKRIVCVSYTITCASISIRIRSMTFRSFHDIDHFCVTWTDSAHFHATRSISHFLSMMSDVRIASSRDGMIQKFSPSFRSIPSLTSRIMENESSVYVSSSVRISKYSNNSLGSLHLA
jgi:hypothetical protein